MNFEFEYIHIFVPISSFHNCVVFLHAALKKTQPRIVVANAMPQTIIAAFADSVGVVAGAYSRCLEFPISGWI